MSEYTPTTEWVRASWSIARSTIDGANADVTTPEFDRWLAEHDRQVSERVWQEGARAEAYASATSKDSFPEELKAINPYTERHKD